jgi:hypothetical protein
MPNDKIFETDKLDDSEFNLVAPEEPEIRRVGSGEKKKNKYNVLLFIFSFVIAMSVWLYVNNLFDSEHEKTVTLVPVSIIGTEELERKHNMSVISGYDNTVTVVLKGSKADVEKYSAGNIYAYVDVSGIDSAERCTLPIVIEPIPDVSVTVVTPTDIAVYADVIGQREIEVIVKPFYTVDGNYFIDENEITQSVDYVTVTGPVSVLDTISYAVAEANIGKVTSSVKSNTYISLVNEKGAKISNPYLSCSTDIVTVNIPVQMKKEVTLKCDYSSDEFEGYEVTIKITDPTAVISGEVLKISRIEEITIFTLRKSHFDFTGVGDNKLDFVRTVEIKLPEGFKFDGGESKAVIEATITKINPPEPETTEPVTDVTLPIETETSAPAVTEPVVS